MWYVIGILAYAVGLFLLLWLTAEIVDSASMRKHVAERKSRIVRKGGK